MDSQESSDAWKSILTSPAATLPGEMGLEDEDGDSTALELETGEVEVCESPR